jgi:hypothetical protein
MEINIIACGSRVTTKLNAIEAIITGVTIRFNALAYELSYFDKAEYKQIWMNESEFGIKDGSVQQIGFLKR